MVWGRKKKIEEVKERPVTPTVEAESEFHPSYQQQNQPTYAPQMQQVNVPLPTPQQLPPQVQRIDPELEQHYKKMAEASRLFDNLRDTIAFLTWIELKKGNTK